MPDQPFCKVSKEKLHAYVRSILHAVDVHETASKPVADSLILADCRGVFTHGVTLLRGYVELIRDGFVDPRAVPKLEVDSGPILRFDAGHGLGISTSDHVVSLAIERAQIFGVCIAGVRNSTHFGMAAYYTLKATEHGLIGIAISDANPAVAPWGAADRFLGTNPLSVGIPSLEEPSYNLDMATSIVAAGKIALAIDREEPIPDHWAVDRSGAPTTDPKLALDGALLPFGEAKGSAIGLMIHLLTAVLTGQPSNRGDRPQSLGQLFIMIDPRKFAADDFDRRINERLKAMRQLRPAQGFDRVLSPGQLEYERFIKSKHDGLSLPVTIYQDVVNLGQEVGIAADLD